LLAMSIDPELDARDELDVGLPTTVPGNESMASVQETKSLKTNQVNRLIEIHSRNACTKENAHNMANKIQLVICISFAGLTAVFGPIN